MREMIVVSGLILLGYLAESSVRCVLNESCRIYVEQTQQPSIEEILEDAAAAQDARYNVAEVTAANNSETLRRRHY